MMMMMMIVFIITPSTTSQVTVRVKRENDELDLPGGGVKNHVLN